MPKQKINTAELDSREAQFNALQAKYKDIKEPLTIEPVSPDDVLSLPGVSLNLLCGKDRGIRKGSIVHYWGPRGSLKTTLALEAVREAQRKWPEKSTAYLDTEYRVDLHLANKQVGVNTQHFDEDGVPRFLYRRPATAEDTWELIGDLAASQQFSIIVLDSATAMPGRAELESGEFTLGQVGAAARANSAGLRKYSHAIISSGTILWIINQTRITSVMPVVTIGPTGGNALGFFTTHEFKCERITREREDVHQDIQILSTKMKYTLGMREARIPVMLGKGINQEADIIQAATEAGVVQRAGAYYKYMGEILGQGLEKASEALQANQQLRTELTEQIYELANDE